MAEKAKKYAHKGKPHMNWRAKRKKRMNAKPEPARGRGRGGRGRERPPGQRSPNQRTAPTQQRR